MYSANMGVAAYSKVGMETGVSSADPHKLILMLFEGAILAVAAAKLHMQRKEIAQKGQKISHAISIIDNGLKASLDMKAGGEIAENLSSLYAYMTNKLLLSNLKNDEAGLDEVRSLLSELKGAWEQIGGQYKSAEAQNQAPLNEMQKRAAISYGQI